MDDTLMKILEQTDSEEAVGTLQKWIQVRAREALLEIVEQEVELLCGVRHDREDKKAYYRAGSARSSVYVNGEKQGLRRPRVRRRFEEGSKEVWLKSWKVAQDPKEWEDAMMRAVLCGVSCRGAGRMSEKAVHGASKSNVSRMWQRKAAILIDEMQQSDLGDLKLLALMLDGVVLCRGLVATVALGIDVNGEKQVLGFRVGSSENAEVCRDLLSNLKRRGLKTGEGRRLFAVLDGSEALRSALLEQFPKAVIQRCLVHKERNIRGYLSKRHWKELADLFKRLRICQGKKAALEAKHAIDCFLADKNAQARASFEEAGDELLSLFRLEVPNSLHVSLLSTNAIENAFKNLRRHIGRVARWRKETSQADLWLASGLKLAQQTFRRIKGYLDLFELAAALQIESNQAAVA